MIDHSASHALLIGVSHYNDENLPDVPAATNSLAALRAVLTDVNLCDWPEDRVTVIANPQSASKLALQLRSLATETMGTLLIYFVGHGMLTEAGELCLATSETDGNHPDVTGLEYRYVRKAIINSPAQSKIVILDCCYSGKAIEALGANATDVADVTDIRGAYIITAADQAAHVVPSADQVDRCTSFTEALVEVVRDGVRNESEFLTLQSLYPHLWQKLRARGLPSPNQRGTDTIQFYPFSRNVAFFSVQHNDTLVDIRLTVIDDRLSLPFDLAKLGRDVVDLLDQREHRPLSMEALEGMRDGSGLYKLFTVDRFGDRPVYLGAADDSIRVRLGKALRKISGRQFISLEQIYFSHLYVDTVPSTLLGLNRLTGKRLYEWNRSGFGNKDAGRLRDGARLWANHFDALYPIDLSCIVRLPETDIESLSNILRELSAQLPYNFRYPRTGRHDVRIEVPRWPVTADYLFHLIARALGESWQLTALSGHVILYPESKEYPSAIAYYQGETVRRVNPEFYFPQEMD